MVEFKILLSNFTKENRVQSIDVDQEMTRTNPFGKYTFPKMEALVIKVPDIAVKLFAK